MALKRILATSENITNWDDLPWANVYIKEKPDLDITYPVRQVIQFDSGLMILTGCFKCFVHEGSKLHEYLIEALEVFINQPKGTLDEMIVMLRLKGKFDLFLDDEKQTGYWNKTENKYVQVYSGSIQKENVLDGNPFLAGMGVRTPARAEDEGEGGNSKSLPKAAKKTSRDI